MSVLFSTGTVSHEPSGIRFLLLHPPWEYCTPSSQNNRVGRFDLLSPTWKRPEGS